MGFFKGFIQVFRRELCRIREFPVYMTLSLILPVISFAYFAILLADGIPRNIPIAVLDLDGTPLSRQLTRMIDATATCDVAYQLTDMDEGEKMMREGRIDAIVRIPARFEADIFSNHQTDVVAYLNGLNISANGLMNRDIQTAVTTFSSGVQIQMLEKKGLSPLQAYSQMMPVAFDRHILFNPYTNYAYYLLPSFLPMMLMIFSLLTTVFAIGTELKYGTAGEWFARAGGSTWAALLGKLMPYTLIMILLSLGMNTMMYKYLGVPLNGSPLLHVIAGILFVLAYESIGVLMISVFSNLRLSLSIGGGYSVLAFTFSGLTFPMIAMDGFVRIFCYIFPFTFYTEIFIDQAMRGAPVHYSLPYLGYLSLFILLPLLCLPRLKKISTNELYWRRM